MKRLEFLKEIKSGLFQTAKAIYDPLIEEDVEKFSMAADHLLGITWQPVQKSNRENGVELLFILGKPVLVFFKDESVQAYSGICPECSNLFNYSTLYSTGKCLICEKEYNFLSKKGELKVVELPIKNKNGDWYIGFVSNSKKI